MHTEQAAADVAGRADIPDGEGRDQNIPQAARVRAAGPEEDHGLQRDALEGQRSRSHGGLHPDEPEQRLEAAMN